MSELNLASRAEEFRQAMNEEFGTVRGPGLGDVDDDWRSVRDALLRCAKNVWCSLRGRV